VSDLSRCRGAAIVSGRVQGVGFRHAACTAARALRLTGYVCNAADGTVRTVAEGPVQQVRAYLVWLRQGPPGGFVADVQWDEAPWLDEFHRFEITW
jgi:acylphosphatase